MAINSSILWLVQLLSQDFKYAKNACDDFNKFATGKKEYDNYYEKEVLPIWCSKPIKETITKYKNK